MSLVNKKIKYHHHCHFKRVVTLVVTGALMAATVDLDMVIVTNFLYTHRMLKFYIDLDGKKICFAKIIF